MVQQHRLCIRNSTPAPKNEHGMVEKNLEILDVSVDCSRAYLEIKPALQLVGSVLMRAVGVVDDEDRHGTVLDSNR